MPQSLAQIYVHIVFSTKGRRDLLPPSHFGEIYSFMAQAVKDCDSTPVIIGGTTNHVHLLVSLGRTCALADLVCKVKSCSSRWLNKLAGSYLASDPAFLWQEGYGAFSISSSHVKAVKEYIANQEEHHKGILFQDEFRRLCKLYEMEIDERYVWD